MKVICVNNNNWFGTLRKEYEVLEVKDKVLKEIKHSNDVFKYIAYTVIDDYGQKVDISSNMFVLK